MYTSSINSSSHNHTHSSSNTTSGNNLKQEELQQVEKLAARDREVKAHEQAHLNAAGSYASSAPSFTYQTGPDGKSYAIGGEVQIDTSTTPGDPEATLRKAEIIRRAALAPAQPSDQDRAVAQSASAMIVKAQIELLQQTQNTSDSSHTKPRSGSNINHAI